MTAKIHHFDSTVRAYDATQTRDDIKKGDVLIIESEKVVGLADTWPVAITEWPGELHDLAPGYTLEKMGFSGKSIALARDAAETLGFVLAGELGQVGYDHAAECLDRVMKARAEAEVKAWDALGRYKFEMFGYWASSWVKFNQALPKLLRAGNPFKRAVDLARSVRDEQG